MAKSVIIRVVALFLALLNQVAIGFGWSPMPFTSEEIEYGVSVVVTVVVAFWSWWKNNSVTPEAQEADRYLEEMKTKTKEPKQF